MMSELTAACQFGLYHFGWATYVFAILGLISATDPREPITRLRFFSESFFVVLFSATCFPPWTTPFYEGLTFSETCVLGLFHALTASTFVHYLDVYLDFRNRRPIFLELFGIVLLAGTFFAAWSTGLAIHFHSSAYRF
jgi:hypothetical protein